MSTLICICLRRPHLLVENHNVFQHILSLQSKNDLSECMSGLIVSLFRRNSKLQQYRCVKTIHRKRIIHCKKALTYYPFGRTVLSRENCSLTLTIQYKICYDQPFNTQYCIIENWVKELIADRTQSTASSYCSVRISPYQYSKFAAPEKISGVSNCKQNLLFFSRAVGKLGKYNYVDADADVIHIGLFKMFVARAKVQIFLASHTEGTLK